MCDRIDDEPNMSASQLPSVEPNMFPLDERGVYAACSEQFRIINLVAIQMFSCTASSIDGAGGRRSFSQADFVVQTPKAANEGQAEAVRVLAVVKVRNILDLPLESGDTWESNCRDKDRLERVEQALQQVAPFHKP